MIITISAKPSPLTIVALVLLGGGVYGLSRDGGTSASRAACAPGDATCEDAQAFLEALPTGSGPAPTLDAAQACINVGYLCADLAQNESIRLQRWHDFEGTLVVHVPVPEFEEPSVARALQRAAAQGLRAWNNQPFPILADMRGDQNPHFAVRWTTNLGASQIGVARTQWSPANGLGVLSIELVTRSPFNQGQPTSARQVRLTAAHEMGHALGLQHSDSPRDLMYPSNTATSMSARDYRTLEVLYQMDDGTVIRR